MHQRNISCRNSQQSADKNFSNNIQLSDKPSHSIFFKILEFCKQAFGLNIDASDLKMNRKLKTPGFQSIACTMQQFRNGDLEILIPGDHPR